MMNQPTDNTHRIRLKGPWEARFVSSDQQETSDFQRIHVPITWREAFGDRAGTVFFKRRFHAPTGLDEHDQVQIRIPHEAGQVSDFRINETSVLSNRDDALVFVVTQYLEDFSEIQFTLSFDPQTEPETPGGLWEAVLLEIVSP